MMGRLNPYEQACLDALTPACLYDGAETPSTPIVFSSPHSGSIYPDALCEMSLLSLENLRRNEDVKIDDLYATVTEHGAAFIKARFPRCYVDVNRAPDEWPPYSSALGPETYMPSTARARAGLGVIPTVIADELPIYDRPLRKSTIKARLNALYYPYHGALQTALDKATARFGHALLIDCHSMPGFTISGTRRPDIVLGDRYGTSCQPTTLRFIEDIFKAHGYSVSRNAPYAGGYITSHYGKHETHVEAIQIEINRDLYLNPQSYTLKRSYDGLKQNLETITQQIISGFCRVEPLAAQ